MDIEKIVKETLKKAKISKKDKILVAMSGGKDSGVVAYLLKKFGYNIEGFYIDLKIGKYSKECFSKVKGLCKDLGIKLHIYDSEKEIGSSMCYLRSKIHSKTKLKNCAICGVIKKWIFNKEARKLRVDKIATGHNLDDEAETFLLNVLKASLKLSANIGVVSRNSSSKKFIPRIKPLFYIPKNEVEKFAKKKIPFYSEPCPCRLDSYRIQVRKFLESLSDKEKKNIIRNFDKIKNLIKVEKTGINYCEICGEPSRNEICKRCELMRD